MDNQAYIRKLNSQELGYRRGAPQKAGRYILVSKQALELFPPLSDSVLNDHIMIYLIPPNSDRAVLTNFVYHNSKIAEEKPGGRDEFRIYLNSGNDTGRDFFKPDDIVVFHRELMEVADEEKSYAYRTYYFPAERKGSEYEKLEELLSRGEVRGSHALVPVSRIPFIEFSESAEVEAKVIPEEVRTDAFKDPVIEKTVVQRTEFSRIIRGGSFRDLVLFFYNYQCAVSGTVIKYGDLISTHAAHIVPKQARGGDNPTNGIALNRDLHWAFDKGFFTVETDYKVLVHREAEGIKQLAVVNHRQIFLPQDERARPNLDCLKWHKENIFGIFTR